jgi:hypothetical protein
MAGPKTLQTRRDRALDYEAKTAISPENRNIMLNLAERWRRQLADQDEAKG